MITETKFKTISFTGFIEEAKDNQIQLEDQYKSQISGLIDQVQASQIQQEDSQFRGLIDQGQHSPIHMEDQCNSRFGRFIKQGKRLLLKLLPIKCMSCK